MIQFFAPDIETSHTLGPEETAHCVKVLRKKEGDVIYVTDGVGHRFECRISGAKSHKVTLDILEKKLIPKGWTNEITLVVAPTKNADRMSWLIEKATEIGVDSILLTVFDHSERAHLNIERLRRNAISAMNQSLKTRMPDIEGLLKLNDILYLEGEKYFGYCNSELERTNFSGLYRGHRDVVIAIGPEGDFSEREVGAMLEAGYRAVTFGDERLRTETAALYGVTAVHVINSINR